MANPQLLVDMQTGEVLYAEEAGQRWHPASLTKLMTAYVAFEAIASGRVRLDTPVIISENALAQPPSKIGAPVETAYRLEDALYLLIVKSANDIAVAIGEAVAGSEVRFVAEMNATATALGMSATHYVNPNGLHDPAQVTSARDLAILTLAIRLRHPQFAPVFSTGTVRLGKARLTTQNSLLLHFAGTDGMKTGYVCSSGLNLVATVERGGRSLLAVMLGSASGRERGEMTAQLFLRGFAGELRGNGVPVSALANLDAAPIDMRANLCGKGKKAYVALRAAEFPLGLEGHPSYLTETIDTPNRQVLAIGRTRNVPLPRPRPLWMPSVAAASLAAQPGDGSTGLRSGLKAF